MLIWTSSSQPMPLSCTTLSMSPREYLAHFDGSAASASGVQGPAGAAEDQVRQLQADAPFRHTKAWAFLLMNSS